MPPPWRVNATANNIDRVHLRSGRRERPATAPAMRTLLERLGVGPRVPLAQSAILRADSAGPGPLSRTSASRSPHQDPPPQRATLVVPGTTPRRGARSRGETCGVVQPPPRQTRSPARLDAQNNRYRTGNPRFAAPRVQPVPPRPLTMSCFGRARLARPYPHRALVATPARGTAAHRAGDQGDSAAARVSNPSHSCAGHPGLTAFRRFAGN